MSELQLGIFCRFCAPGAAGSPRPDVELLDERDESLSLERKNEMRQGRALKLWWKEWRVSVRFSVDDDRAAWGNGQSGAESVVFQRLRGDNRDRREVFVECACYFTNRRCEKNFVSEPNQCLREPLEQGDVSTDKQHFCHYAITSISQALNLFQIDSTNLDQLGSRRVAGHDAHIAPRSFQGCGKKIYERLVRHSLYRWSGHAHFQGFSLQSDYFIAR